MGLGLKALRRASQLEVIDRAGLRKPAERLLFRATKQGFRTATTAGRAFTAAQQLGRPARQRTAGGSGLFDLTPTDEQQMLQESLGDFAAKRLAPAAQEADAACPRPPSCSSRPTSWAPRCSACPRSSAA